MAAGGGPPAGSGGNDELFRQQSMLAINKQDDGDGSGANEKDIFDTLFSFFDKAVSFAAKLTGVNLTQLGQVSVLQQVEPPRGGGVEKAINPGAGSFSMKGNAIYRVFVAALVKNRTITDHTAGIGKNEGEGGSSSSSSSGDYAGPAGGGDFLAFNAPAAGENFVASYTGDKFTYVEASRADLGNFSPPSTGGAMVDRGAGIDI